MKFRFSRDNGNRFSTRKLACTRGAGYECKNRNCVCKIIQLHGGTFRPKADLFCLRNRKCTGLTHPNTTPPIAARIALDVSSLSPDTARPTSAPGLPPKARA